MIAERAADLIRFGHLVGRPYEQSNIDVQSNMSNEDDDDYYAASGQYEHLVPSAPGFAGNTTSRYVSSGSNILKQTDFLLESAPGDTQLQPIN